MLLLEKESQGMQGWPCDVGRDAVSVGSRFTWVPRVAVSPGQVGIFVLIAKRSKWPRPRHMASWQLIFVDTVVWHMEFPSHVRSGQTCQTIQSDGSGCVFLRARCSDVWCAAFIAKLPSLRLERDCDTSQTLTMCQGVVDSARCWARGCFLHVPQVRQAHGVTCLHSEAGSKTSCNTSTIHIHPCKDILTLENGNWQTHCISVLCVILLFSLNACHECFWGGTELSLIWRLSRTSRLGKCKTLEKSETKWWSRSLQDFNIFNWTLPWTLKVETESRAKLQISSCWIFRIICFWTVSFLRDWPYVFNQEKRCTRAFVFMFFPNTLAKSTGSPDTVLTFAPQGSDILYSVLRVPAAWGSDCCLSERYCTVLIAYARRKARKMHILRVLQNFAGVTLLSEWFGQINLWRHQRHWASQYNLIMRSDFHDSFWTLSFSLSIEGRHSGWSGFRSPDKCFLFTFFDTVSKPDSPASFLPTMMILLHGILWLFMHVLNFAYVTCPDFFPCFAHPASIFARFAQFSPRDYVQYRRTKVLEVRDLQPVFFPDYTMHWN